MKLNLDPEAWTAAYAPRAAETAHASLPLTFSDQAAVNATLRLLNERADAVAKSLQDGMPATVEAYREMVGELRGVRFAIDAVRTAEREANGSEPIAPKEKPLYVA